MTGIRRKRTFASQAEICYFSREVCSKASKMKPYRALLAVAMIVSMGSTAPAAASIGVTAVASDVGSSLNEPSVRKRLDDVIARERASGVSDPRIHVREGPCNDGMPTCYDGPSNTIFIADDPSKYMYKTDAKAGQPALYPYSWE